MALLRHAVRLTTLSTLAVSGEPGVRGYELSTARRADGRAYVPGTSVRGALRTAASLLASILGLPCCMSKDPGEVSSAHRSLEGSGLECVVCKVWGGPGRPSKLVVSDFEPDERACPVPPVDRVPHIEVDDYLSTVRMGAFRVEEALAPGSVFRGEILLETDGLNYEHYLLLLGSMSLLPAVGLGRGGMAFACLDSVVLEGPEGRRRGAGPSEAAQLAALAVEDLEAPDVEELLKILWCTPFPGTLFEAWDRSFESMARALELLRKKVGGGGRRA